jgi:hypothetical protein
MYDVKNTIVPTPLTKANILRRVSESYIMKHYLGFEFELGKAYKSPVREDSNPSFALYKTQDGSIKFKDFNGAQGSCFDLVMLLHGLDYSDCLQRINIDLNLRLGTSKVVPDSTIPVMSYTPQGESNGVPRLIQFKPKHFTITDLEYWAQYGIPKWVLKYFNVFSAQYVFLDKRLLLRATNRDPIYCYKFPKTNRVKVYKPKVRDKTHIKWLSNVTSDDIQGEEQLLEGEELIITKSLKDVMVLFTFNYPAIAPQAEGTRNQYSKILKIAEGFKEVTILFDYDPTGIKGAEELRDYLRDAGISVRIVYIIEEDSKDISDFVASRGIKATSEFLKELIDEPRNKS